MLQKCYFISFQVVAAKLCALTYQTTNEPPVAEQSTFVEKLNQQLADVYNIGNDWEVVAVSKDAPLTVHSVLLFQNKHKKDHVVVAIRGSVPPTFAALVFHVAMALIGASEGTLVQAWNSLGSHLLTLYNNPLAFQLSNLYVGVQVLVNWFNDDLRVLSLVPFTTEAIAAIRPHANPSHVTVGKTIEVLIALVLSLAKASLFLPLELVKAVLFQIQPKTAAPAQPMISYGSNSALKDIATQQLVELVKNKTTVDVIGHSLGGALASVVAPWLKAHLAGIKSGAKVRATTLAGPTAGNAAFAAYLEEQFPGDQFRRVVNPIDVVPLAWSVESILKIPSLYKNPLPANYGPLINQIASIIIAPIVWVIALVVAFFVAPYNYTQPKKADTKDTIVLKTAKESPQLSVFFQVGHQHDFDNYIKLTEAIQEE